MIKMHSLIITGKPMQNNAIAHPSYINYRLKTLPAMFNQQLFLQPLWKLQTISITNGSHHVLTTKLTLFKVSNDEWDTNDGTGKSIKTASYEQQCPKRYLLGWSNVVQQKKKIKSVALAIVELRKSEGIRQAED